MEKTLLEAEGKSQKARNNTGQAHVQHNIADIKNLILIITNAPFGAFKKLKAKNKQGGAAHPARGAHRIATNSNVYARAAHIMNGVKIDKAVSYMALP